MNPSASASAEDTDPDPDPRTRTRREEAFTLYCQGYRSPAIASLLGVPQRTVRSWIAATLQQTADEARTRRDHQLRLAIESQRAIVQAAWHAYARAARAERLTLEHLQNAVPLNVDGDDAFDATLDLDPYGGPDPYHSPSPRQLRGGQGVRTSLALPRLPTLGARSLQIVLHAQREIARLSGLYHLPDTVHDPNAGRPMQIVIRREAHLPREQRAAWTAFRDQWDADHPADPVPPDDLVFPPPGAPLHDYAEPADPDYPETDDNLEAESSPTAGSFGAGRISDQLHHAPGGDLDSMPAGLQTAQAGFVADWSFGADSSAGSPSASCSGMPTPRSLQSETAAETASPSLGSPTAADPTINGPVQIPPDVVHPGGPIPPALLPRFRRCPATSPLPTSYPSNRGAP